MAAPIYRQPSRRFLQTGEATDGDQRAIDTLARRRDYLNDEIDPDVGHYDRREAAALSWALRLVATVKQRGGVPE